MKFIAALAACLGYAVAKDPSEYFFEVDVDHFASAGHSDKF